MSACIFHPIPPNTQKENYNRESFLLVEEMLHAETVCMLSVMLPAVTDTVIRVS